MLALSRKAASHLRRLATMTRLRYDQAAADCDPVVPPPMPRCVKVTVCGCNGRVGRYLSLLLKQSSLITHLSLHDITTVPESVASIRHIDTNCKASVFSGKHLIKPALQEADIVVIAAGIPRTQGLAKADLFKQNADIVAELAEMCSEMCPRALFAIVTNPINSLVPIMSEVLHLNESYDRNRVFGVPHTYVVCASTLTAREQAKDPRGVLVPVVGGNTPCTLVPVLSLTKPCSLPNNTVDTIMKPLSNHIKTSGMDVVRAKDYKGSANICTAYAAAQFVISLAKGLHGHPSIIECAYVRSNAVPGCKYLITPVELGEYGIKHNYGLPKLNEFELQQLKEAIPQIKEDIYLGETYFRYKYMLQR